MNDIFQIITPTELHEAFKNTNFGDGPTKRDMIRNGLLKRATGHYTGKTIQRIMIELKLITYANKNLTKKGRNYLYHAFEDGTSV